MDGETLWDRILSNLSSSGEELQTTTGRWFRAISECDKLFVDKAQKHTPSSKLSMKRPISKKDFLIVHSYHDRWANGETGVRQEVIGKSRNSAYIFALIDKFDN